jgi:hypothetical protein
MVSDTPVVWRSLCGRVDAGEEHGQVVMFVPEQAKASQ